MEINDTNGILRIKRTSIYPNTRLLTCATNIAEWKLAYKNGDGRERALGLELWPVGSIPTISISVCFSSMLIFFRDLRNDLSHFL